MSSKNKRKANVQGTEANAAVAEMEVVVVATENVEAEATAPETIEEAVVVVDEDAELIGAIEAIIAKEEKRGRPINPTSARQIRLATKAALIEAGVNVDRGRKVDPTSERQKRLNAFAEKWGDQPIKRGRPKMEKAVVAPAEPVVEATAPETQAVAAE
jgi:hypothetical protein